MTKYTVSNVWYCVSSNKIVFHHSILCIANRLPQHNCSSGPHSCKINTHCASCYHPRCSYCTVTQTKVPVGR
ncbi:hypothetical protein BDP55DRAFT_674655 [Colletotrichum godetiae]|uniref:Uncharacterized protein n=1 Tax=Colletotrichum godetiae TaxID=1209918 RepID=A0AAJ0ADM7_9PEZI|nr:uncharacterized protein BDP55DRAFT_674655 [Colletotrichum godetiae]KAK1671951.1 hypothetical protein BDP55DRAFT_674655 [Colletotrichum godetiae]